MSKTTPGVIMGTVEYMSPEQVTGKDVDQRTDLFSLGVVLYDMTTGRLPFSEETATDTMHNILPAEPEVLARFNPKAPAGLGQIVGKCLEKSRELRYQSANELRVDIKRLKRELEAEQGEVARRKTKRLRYAKVAAVAAVVLTMALLGGYWLGRSRRATQEAPLIAVPLTSCPGSEDFPSFSPDGNRVAFSWNGPEQDNFDIYIKQIGVDPPTQLTSDPAEDFSPAWSPDGRYIAFLRKTTPVRAALILIPQRGGGERVLAESDLSPAWRPHVDGPYLAWTPDSKRIVAPLPETASKTWALYSFSIATGEKRKLTNPPATEGGDTSPAVSPDGRTLAFVRFLYPISNLLLLRLGEGCNPLGVPERVQAENPLRMSVAWTPDGREIVFSSQGALWRVAASASAKPRRLPLASEDARVPAISRLRNRLAFVLERSDINIWRVDLRGPDRKPGVPFRFIFSTRTERGPAFSPDGKRIAFASDRSGAGETWLCDSDGSNLVQLTSSGGGSGKWSPDGQSLAFWMDKEGNGNDDVYVISVNGGVPRRLTTDPASDHWPYWSQDGQSIYFGSNRSGAMQIWRMAADGGNAVQISRDDGADVPQESPDGRFVYYCKGYPAPLSVWRLPVEGDTATKVLEGVHARALWAVARNGIYFFTAPDGKDRSDLSIYDFATGKTRKVLTIERPVTWTIEVSPDGRTVLWPQVDAAGSDLMLVENFK